MQIQDPNGIDLKGNNLKNVGGVENVPDGTIVSVYGEDSSGNLIKDDVPSGGGATAFTDLTDVPQSYTDQAGKMLVVNENENGLEYIDLGTVITDSHTHTNKDVLDGIIDSGDGDEFLSDDGTYKAAGLAYFEESRSVAAPNATVPAHQIIPKGEETNIDVVISPKGTGSILAQVPDNTATGGNKRGYKCVDLQSERYSADQVCVGYNSAILSGSANRIYGKGNPAGYGAQNAVICGGNKNLIIGSNYSFGGSTHYSFIGAGYSNTINSANHGTVACHSIINGFENSIDCNITTEQSTIINGNRNLIKNSNCLVSGQYAKAQFVGQHCIGNGYFEYPIKGQVQASEYILYGKTLDTNYYRLFLNCLNSLIDLSQAGAYSTWQCKLKVTGLRRLTGAIDHYVSEHNFMIYRENSTPVIADFTEIHVHQVGASSVATGVSITTNSLAIDIATTENNWQFVAHLETVETFSDSLV